MFQGLERDGFRAGHAEVASARVGSLTTGKLKLLYVYSHGHVMVRMIKHCPQCNNYN